VLVVVSRTSTWLKVAGVCCPWQFPVPGVLVSTVIVVPVFPVSVQSCVARTPPAEFSSASSTVTNGFVETPVSLRVTGMLASRKLRFEPIMPVDSGEKRRASAPLFPLLSIVQAGETPPAPVNAPFEPTVTALTVPV
jgi:hypothetical protein